MSFRFRKDYLELFIPLKQIISISINDFKKLIKFSQIFLDQQQCLDIQQGGVYIIIDDFRTILGGILETNYLKPAEKKKKN